jgi:hypothetical protein
MTNREEWLIRAKDRIIELIFTPNDLRMPPKICVACGICPGSAVGFCTRPEFSDESAIHIWISPELGNGEIMQILGVLCHELCHAQVFGDGYESCSHGHPFSSVIRTIGLEGKPRSATAHEGTELWATLQGIASELGNYPHAPLRKKEKKTRQSEMITYISETDEEYAVKLKFSQVYEKGAPRDFNDQPMKPKDQDKFAELEANYLSQPDEEQEAADAEEKAAE